MPPHNLQLKVGSPVILLHNLNSPRLWNSTRLVIKKLIKNVIETNHFKWQILKWKYTITVNPYYTHI
jgi:hypothetical protein